MFLAFLFHGDIYLTDNKDMHVDNIKSMRVPGSLL
jgi:hypothetical protein